MLDDGVYGLRYTGEVSGEPESGSGLAVLRDGKVLGSDPFGGVFAGRHEYDELSRLDKLYVRFGVPPNGTLVSGFSGGPEGATVDIVAAIDSTRPLTSTLVDVAGAPVEIEITYLGPLPL